MRIYYDNDRLVVEIRPRGPLQPAGAVANHPQVTQYADTQGQVQKYVIEQPENNRQWIEGQSFVWMAQQVNLMEKNDLEALKLLKEWCTWLVAIETAILAAIVIIQKDIQLSSIGSLTVDDVYAVARGLASFTIVALAFSIYHAGNMLLVLPAVAQRLPPQNGQDIYSLTNPAGFHWNLTKYVRFVRYSSMVGLLSFGALLLWVIVCYKHA
jgi:hypothetical protein